MPTHAALRGAQTVNDPTGTNLLQVLLHCSHLTTDEGPVFMPSFAGYSDADLAAVPNYVLAQFGGKEGRLAPADVAAARRLD